MALESLYQIYLKHPQICTDTRNITEGCIFFALKGDRFDANEFAAQALSQGAAYAVVDNPSLPPNAKFIVVENVLNSLQELAKYHRQHLNIPVIGLTGSNGKTTSKELIQAVMSQKFKSYATKGNLNNHIGVPLTLLSLPKETEFAIIEMGANHQKEIEFLCSIAQPTHGLITNIGMAHLEGFGGYEGVKKGKSELYRYLEQTGGTVFLDEDNQTLVELAKNLNLKEIVSYGTKSNVSIKGSLIANNPYIEIAWENAQQNPTPYHVKTHLTGAYNFSNILAAVCIGNYFGVTTSQIETGLNHYIPQNNRSQIEKSEFNTIICDYYNANPSSMEVALTNLANQQANAKTIILGSMFELGNESTAQHQRIHNLALDHQFDNNIFIGEGFYQLPHHPNAKYFKTPADAKIYLNDNPLKQQMILLKGSRGMALEQLMPNL